MLPERSVDDRIGDDRTGESQRMSRRDCESLLRLQPITLASAFTFATWVTGSEPRAKVRSCRGLSETLCKPEMRTERRTERGPNDGPNDGPNGGTVDIVRE